MENYKVKVRRTVVRLEETEIDVYAPNEAWALTNSLALAHESQDWKEVVEEQILLNLASSRDLSIAKHLESTAQKIQSDVEEGRNNA